MKKKLTALLLSLLICASTTVTAFAAPIGSFTDTDDNAWYAEAVTYAIDHKLFSGTSDTTFEPNVTMTRGMFVTVLANMSGVDADLVKDNGVFDDVDFDAWFGPNVVWANENNIVAGTSDTTFEPNVAVTREEIAVMLQRYLTNLGIDMEDADDAIESFKDADKVSTWAKEAVDAVRKWGIVYGDPDGNYNPGDKTTRAEAATMLARIHELLDGDANHTPKAVTVSDKVVDLVVGDTYTIAAFVAPTAAKQDVTYSSDNSAVSVNADGVITANAVGKATITATCADDSTLKTTITVNVTEKKEEVETPDSPDVTIEVDGYTLSDTSLTLVQGTKHRLSYTGNTPDGAQVVWRTSDSMVARTELDGTVIAVAPGTVTVTLLIDQKVAGVCKVTVTEREIEQTPGSTAKTFECSNSPITITTSIHGWDDYYEGNLAKLRFNDYEGNYFDAEYTPSYWNAAGLRYTFESSDTSIIKVDETGGLYDPIRLKPGEASKTATITVTKEGDGVIKVPVTIVSSDDWYTVNDEYIDMFAEKVAEYTNDLREEAGLSRMKFMPGATDVLEIRAKELAEDFSHTRPADGPDMVYVDTDGVSVNLGHENIEYISINFENGGVNVSPESLAKTAVTNWYNSPGHRTAMMTPSNTRIGVGLTIVSTGDPYGLTDGCAYMVQTFSGQ